MHRLWLIVAVAPVLGFIGCSQAPVDMVAVPDGLDVPILRETRGMHSPILKPLRTAIYSAGQAAQFPIQLPDADFEHEMILVAAMGPAPDPGCSIRIVDVQRAGNKLQAVIEQRYPPTLRRRLRGVVSPYHAVVIPQTALTIEGFSAQLPPRAIDYERRGLQ
ncbi:MAG: hypothetical protein H6817_02460 [Phycisphaerales bacterium]|nr:hypothetical protein [Phycisphaerales bacterium]